MNPDTGRYQAAVRIHTPADLPHRVRSMRSTSRTALLGLLAAPVLLVASACSPTDEVETSAKDPASVDVRACASEDLDGKLSVATDSPAYEPWFSGDDPSNGKGFELAVAYEMADRMGFAASDVVWVTVPFNNAYAPGEKPFDFDINQISITPKRAKVVDFSQGYYSASQAVIALDQDKVTAASLADLAELKLGAQTGTTSLTAITDVIKPATEPLIFDDTNAAKQAMLNGQVDAIVADLPTAFYITGVEIDDSSIIGQFQPETGSTEEFGVLLEKGNPFLGCVDAALTEMKNDGTLAELETEWLSTSVDVPVLN